MALRSDSAIGRFVHLASAALLSASALALSGAPAAAHHYRPYRHYPHVAYRPRAHAVHQAASSVPFSPAFSALVVDANSGRTLYSVAEDGLRHPASITKVMTLYLLFEQLDSGAINLRTQIPISEHAAAQEPSKLGLAPGQTISVEDAIKAVVTRSANDIAVAIAEAVGHDEDSFAEMMTRKARALGMASTVYRNASGLPNDEQITTAHDLAILGRALEERFPRYFRYFSTHEFEYAGEIIGNHNHLLGRVDGVDGIKTGYTRASGFNLLTSVHRDGRSLIAVVMGGRSAGARDRVMENLIADHIAEASTAHTATMIAENTPTESAPEPAGAREAAPARARALAVAANVPAANAGGPIEEGDNADGDDETPASRLAKPATAAAAQPQGQTPAARPKVNASLAIPAPRAPAESRQKKGPEATAAPKATHAASPSQRQAAARLKPALSAHSRTPQPTPVATQASGAGGRWIVQIGATDNPAKANALLARARAHDRSALASAKPLTEKVRKRDGTLYRARFAGLDSASAESACRELKRDGFSCFAAPD